MGKYHVHEVYELWVTYEIEADSSDEAQDILEEGDRDLCNEIGRDTGGVLIPTNDHYLMICSRHHTALSNVFKMSVPPWTVLEPLMDKISARAIALEAGLEVPHQFQPKSEGELDSELANLDLSERAYILKIRLWDSGAADLQTLRRVAQGWAESCTDNDSVEGLIDHNMNRADDYGSPVGENVFGASSGATPAETVELWASELADYDYDSNSCAQGSMCGHYTQIVWADSTLLGCGINECASLQLARSIFQAHHHTIFRDCVVFWGNAVVVEERRDRMNHFFVNRI